jgi:heat shock protein HtpX
MQRTSFYREIASNKMRTFVLMLVFALIVLAVGYAFGEYMGNRYAGLVLAFVVSLVMAFGSYYWSDKIVLAMSRARPVEKHEYPHLYNVLEEMAIASGLPAPKAYVIDDPSPNAFATGRNPKHAVIAVTTGLLEMTDRYELEGVVAHEMSHVQNYDVLVQTVAVVLAGMVMLMSDWMLRSMFWGGMRGQRRGRREGQNPVALVLALLGIVLAIVGPILAQMMRLAISRRREYLADASAVKLTRYPDGLASALEKLASYNAPVRTANKVTAGLFIVNPLKGASVSELFSTHPPIDERIRRIRAMDIGAEGARGGA